MPEFEYAEWDGSQQFQSLSAAEAFDTLSEFLLDHGEYVLRQLRRDDPASADLLDKLIKEGYLERDEDGALAVTPKGVRRIQDRALGDLFQVNKRDPLGKQPAQAAEAPKKFEFSPN